MSQSNQSLEEILFGLAAQKTTPAERTAFLDGVCQDNLVLRAALEELLEAHFRAAGFLPTRESCKEPPPVLLPPISSGEANTAMVGRYQLFDKIGEGGFGEVWRAEQLEPVKRVVALKIIKPGMDSRQVVARFEAERQALAMMDHPNIAKVFDGGVIGIAAESAIAHSAFPGLHSPLTQGRPYFVMELVRGMKITEYCDQHTLSTEGRLKLFTQVCQAIQHAHQKGIIHRDIKPSNILVAEHDDVAVPKVIDFGIAKATQGELTDKTVLTHFQQFIGTPAYISPEQAEMSGLDVDTRADIYSLGVLLYELLVGQTPFDPRKMVASGLDELRKTIREEEPLKPSTRLKQLSAAELTATAQRRQTESLQLTHLLRGDLDWIVMKCLEKDRTRRYQTANSLATELKRYLANEPVLARPPSAAYKFQKTWQRNRLAFTAIATVAFLLLAGTGVSTWQALRATRAQRLAQQRLIEVSAERDAKEKAKIELETRHRELREAAYATAIQSAAAGLEHDDLENARLALDRADPLLRGWEWAHLNLRLPLFRRFDGPVSVGAVLTRDMARVACACNDATLRVFDAHTGTSLRLFRLSSFPNSLALSPDDGCVALGDTNGVVRVHDLATGAVRWEAQGHAAWIYSLAFSPDGLRLTSAGFDGAIVLWDTMGRPLVTNQIAAKLRGLAFDPDGRTLLAGDFDHGGRILTADGLEEIYRLSPIAGGRRCVAFSPDGRQFATGDADGFVRVWDTAQRKVIVTSALSHTRDLSDVRNGLVVSNVYSVAFSPDGRSIASGGQDRMIRVWDAKTGRLLDTFPTKTVLNGWMPGLQFSADSAQLLAVGRDAAASARLWNLRHDRFTTEVVGHASAIWSAAFTADSQRLVTAGWDGKLRLAHAGDGREIRSFSGHSNLVVWSVAVSSDGRRAVSGSQDGTVRLWDLETAKALRVISVQRTSMSEPDLTLFVALNPDGQQVVSGGYDGRVQVWNLDTGARQWELTNRTGRIWSIAWSADGRRIVAGRSNGQLTLIDALRGAELWHSNHGTKQITSLSFRQRGQEILTASVGGELRLWDSETGRLLREADMEPIVIRSLAPSPDGRRVASASDDGIVRIWDANLRGPLFALPRESARINVVAFSPDGQQLAVGLSDGKARLWETSAKNRSSSDDRLP